MEPATYGSPTAMTPDTCILQDINGVIGSFRERKKTLTSELNILLVENNI